MRFAFRIAGSAAALLLSMLGTAAAATHWDPQPNFIQNDCAGGLRDYGSRLMDIPQGSDWMTVCQKMPADFLDGSNLPHHFNAPTRCEFHKDILGNIDGIWGHFGVPETCPKHYTVGAGCEIFPARGQSTGSLSGAVAAILGIGLVRCVRRRPRNASPGGAPKL
jgi:hypothetical protein